MTHILPIGRTSHSQPLGCEKSLFLKTTILYPGTITIICLLRKVKFKQQYFVVKNERA